MTQTPTVERAATMGKHVSFSQVDKKCGYQLRFYRERIPATERGISLIYGSAVGAGIQHYVTHEGCSPEHAVEMGIKALDDEIERPRRPLPIRWDDPPRLTKAGAPYATDASRIGNREQAEKMLAGHVRTWIARFPDLRATAVEEKAEVELSRPKGWKLIGYIDIHTTDQGLIDLKTAAKEWDDEKIAAASPQLQLYQGWYRRHYGRAPAWTQFHVLVKGSMTLQVIDVPYDVTAINRYLEHVVRTNIAAIEANTFVPNTAGWWHDARYCDYWSHCPLGAAAAAGNVEGNGS